MNRNYAKLVCVAISISNLIHSSVGVLPRCASRRDSRNVNCNGPRVANFRTYDGTCNNLEDPLKGSAHTRLLRLLEPIYENSRDAPVGYFENVLYEGARKPNVREISKSVMSANFTLKNNAYTAMLAHWGQFVAHDLTLARETEINCVRASGDPERCFNIDLPSEDVRLRRVNMFPFKRSESCFSDAGKREQLNQVTAFIDGSVVYGSSIAEVNRLRNFNSRGELLENRQRGPTGKGLLPFDSGSNIQCFKGSSSGTPCFDTGDIRSNEQPVLTALHTLLVREHNRIANKLARINPQWDSDRVFEETRLTIGALIQSISFHEWLPKVIGSRGMDLMNSYTGYKPNEDPSTANAFATAVLRFGHTIMVPELERYDSDYRPIREGHLKLRDSFFAPERIMNEGGVDPLLRGAAFQEGKEITGNSLVNSELTEHLFPHANRFPLDLASLNIQRGRDHALPSYNEWRSYCGLNKLTTWPEVAQQMRDSSIMSDVRNLYEDPDNIDLWVGGMIERPMAGSILGSTFTCLMVNQFRRSRNGDRFWYENADFFDRTKQDAIGRYSLAKMICNNGDNIERIQSDVFAQHQSLIPCRNLRDLDLNPWRDVSAESLSTNEVRRDQDDAGTEGRASAPAPAPAEERNQEPFECESPECRCRYRPGRWSRCHPSTRLQTRRDSLVSVNVPGATCRTLRLVRRNCATIRPGRR